MASLPGRGVRGGKRESAGRKKKYESENMRRKSWGSQNKRIYLRNNIFEAWKSSTRDPRIVQSFRSPTECIKN